MARARVQHRHGTFSNYENNKTTILNDEIVVVDSGHPDTPDGSALYYRPSGASEPVRVANAGELTEAGINVETVTESQLSDATGDNIYLCVINGRWHKVICVSGSQTRAQYAVSAYHNFIYRWQSKSGDSWGQWTDWSPIGVADNIRDGAITLSKLGTDVLEQLANKGVRIITPEESAGWDDDIPLTFAGDLYDIAGWDYKLWVLNQTAATPEGGTNYFWEPLISAFEFDPALEAKMDLAPLNPTAEQIAALPVGQVYGDTANHKGTIKGGQSFYDTEYIDALIPDISGKEDKIITDVVPPFCKSTYPIGTKFLYNNRLYEYIQAVNTIIITQMCVYRIIGRKLFTQNWQATPPSSENTANRVSTYRVGDLWSNGDTSTANISGYLGGDVYICTKVQYQMSYNTVTFNYSWKKLPFDATTLNGYGIADAYTKTEINAMIPTVPTNISAFTNDSGYLTLGTLPIYDGTVI